MLRTYVRSGGIHFGTRVGERGRGGGARAVWLDRRHGTLAIEYHAALDGEDFVSTG